MWIRFSHNKKNNEDITLNSDQISYIALSGVDSIAFGVNNDVVKIHCDMDKRQTILDDINRSIAFNLTNYKIYDNY